MDMRDMSRQTTYMALCPVMTKQRHTRESMRKGGTEQARSRATERERREREGRDRDRDRNRGERGEGGARGGGGVKCIQHCPALNTIHTANARLTCSLCDDAFMCLVLCMMTHSCVPCMHIHT